MAVEVAVVDTYGRSVTDEHRQRCTHLPKIYTEPSLSKDSSQLARWSPAIGLPPIASAQAI